MYIIKISLFRSKKKHQKMRSNCIKIFLIIQQFLFKIRLGTILFIKWMHRRLPFYSISSEIRCVYTKPRFSCSNRARSQINFPTFPVLWYGKMGTNWDSTFSIFLNPRLRLLFYTFFLPDWVLLLGFLYWPLGRWPL